MKLYFLKIFNKTFSKIFRLAYKKNTPKLPEIFFLIGTAFFPQLNIELIIRDSEGKTLYLWRDDAFGNVGWHLPGGIIRPNERILKRVEKVIEKETNLDLNDMEITGPISFSEVIHNLPGIRSHFISFVYLAELKSQYDKKKLNFLNEEFLLSLNVPKNIIQNHKRYIPMLKESSFSLKSKSIRISK